MNFCPRSGIAINDPEQGSRSTVHHILYGSIGRILQLAPRLSRLDLYLRPRIAKFARGARLTPEQEEKLITGAVICPNNHPFFSFGCQSGLTESIVWEMARARSSSMAQLMRIACTCLLRALYILLDARGGIRFRRR